MPPAVSRVIGKTAGTKGGQKTLSRTCCVRAWAAKNAQVPVTTRGAVVRPLFGSDTVHAARAESGGLALRPPHPEPTSNKADPATSTVKGRAAILMRLRSRATVRSRRERQPGSLGELRHAGTAEGRWRGTQTTSCRTQSAPRSRASAAASSAVTQFGTFSVDETFPSASNVSNQTGPYAVPFSSWSSAFQTRRGGRWPLGSGIGLMLVTRRVKGLRRAASSGCLCEHWPRPTSLLAGG